jgi:hypothetical protein
MRNILNNGVLILVLLMPFLITGCEVVGDIFKAGMWVGIIGIALVVFLVLWIIRKAK